MNLRKELKYRCSSAVDFLCGTIQPDWRYTAAFLDGKPTSLQCDFGNWALTTWVLMVATDYLGKTKLRRQLTEVLDEILKQEFNVDDNFFIIDDDMSITNNNAFVALACLKDGRKENGLGYANTIIECIEAKHVKPYYGPATSQEAIFRFQSIETDYGLIILALMSAYKISRDEKYFKAAKKVLSILIKKLAMFTPYVLEALTFFKPNDLTQHYALKVMRFTNQFSPESLTSLVAAMAQINYEALYILQKGETDKVKDLRSQIRQVHFGLQVDTHHSFGYDLSQFSGAFVRSSNYTEIRLDYCVHSIRSFIMLLNRYDKEKGFATLHP